MNATNELHRIAMEFYELANIAKVKRKPETYENYMEKAYHLAKEAALKSRQETTDQLWQELYLRSIGWLAFKCGKHEEALEWAKLGLSINPSGYEKAQFQEIVREAGKKLKAQKATSPQAAANGSHQHFSGLLVNADMEQHHIKIKENSSFEYHTVSVPQEQMQLVARSFLGEAVEVDVVKDEKGAATLEHIQRAA